MGVGGETPHNICNSIQNFLVVGGANHGTDSNSANGVSNSLTATEDGHLLLAQCLQSLWIYWYRDHLRRSGGNGGSIIMPVSAVAVAVVGESGGSGWKWTSRNFIWRSWGKIICNGKLMVVAEVVVIQLQTGNMVNGVQGVEDKWNGSNIFSWHLILARWRWSGSSLANGTNGGRCLCFKMATNRTHLITGSPTFLWFSITLLYHSELMCLKEKAHFAKTLMESAT